MKKILLIEDTAIYLRVLHQALIDFGYEVILPPTVDPNHFDWSYMPTKEEMVEFLKSIDPDCVLLDIHLGCSYTGWDLLEHFNNNHTICISSEFEVQGIPTWKDKGELTYSPDSDRYNRSAWDLAELIQSRIR